MSNDPVIGFRYDYGMIPKDSITLLDQFAMTALPAVISDPWYIAQRKDYAELAPAIAIDCYRIARAMMAEREKLKCNLGSYSE